MDIPRVNVQNSDNRNISNPHPDLIVGVMCDLPANEHLPHNSRTELIGCGVMSSIYKVAKNLSLET